MSVHNFKDKTKIAQSTMSILFFVCFVFSSTFFYLYFQDTSTQWHITLTLPMQTSCLGAMKPSESWFKMRDNSKTDVLEIAIL